MLKNCIIFDLKYEIYPVNCISVTHLCNIVCLSFVVNRHNYCLCHNNILFYTHVKHHVILYEFLDCVNDVFYFEVHNVQTFQ